MGGYSTTPGSPNSWTASSGRPATGSIFVSVTELVEQLQAALGDRYTIERELGGGGMSRVFVAEEKSLGRKVVVKVLPPEMAAGVSGERFRREILLAARLQHPHIVALLAAGDANGLPYFTMPLVEGESLRDRLGRTGALPIPDVVRILRGVADALAYAHDCGVLHRDIKPGNILLSRNHAFVADFGVAKAYAASSVQPEGGFLTSAGVAIGTPNYIAPEQAMAEPNIDGRADLYSLGAVAYEMLAGHPPFAGRTPQAALIAHLDEQVVPVSNHRPATPPALAALVMHCLEKRPADRVQSAADVVSALDALDMPTTRTSMATTVVSPTPTPAPAPPPRPLLTRQRMWIAGGVTAVLIVGLVVLLWPRAKTAPASAMKMDMPMAMPAVKNSVAVLPFVNVGNDPTTEYFAEGMADELTTALGHIPGLRVAARSSSFTFRGRDANAQDVGQKLHVSNVLEGTVLRNKGRLRVTAQLVSTADGLSVWSDSYQRRANDIFSLQEELAHDIAGALHTTLTDPSADSTLAPRGTTNLGAYDLFLQGRYLLAQGGVTPLRRAIQLFKQAVAADSTFARANAAMAMAYVLLPRYGVRADSVIPFAEQAANRALAFDPQAAEAHLALGDVRLDQWRWHDAETELDKSVDLDPSNPLVHLWHSDLFIGLGQIDAAIDHARMAYDIDPLSPMTSQMISGMLVDARRYDDAIVMARHGLGLDPSLAGLYTSLMEADLFGRHQDSAVIVANRAMRVAPNAPGVRSAAAWVYASTGRRDQAQSLVDVMRLRLPLGSVSALDFANAHLALGETDSALTWIGIGVKQHEAESGWTAVACDPTYDALRHDPRFIALLRPSGIRFCPVAMR
jgi:eukaryotic-like serine/threonine-protein kinase